MPHQRMTLATGSGPAIQAASTLEIILTLLIDELMHAARLSRMSNALAWVSTLAEDSNLQLAQPSTLLAAMAC